MPTPSDIVKAHYDAALAEGADNRIPADVMGRTFISFVVATFRENYDVAAFRDELQGVVDNLDPDQEYEFMRP